MLSRFLVLPGHFSDVSQQLTLPHPDRSQLIAISLFHQTRPLAVVPGLLACNLKRVMNILRVRPLIHLLRSGILPTGYIYPKEERVVRDLLRKRSQLVRQSTTNILSVQNILLPVDQELLMADPEGWEGCFFLHKVRRR